jgi:hypothetical protein
MNSITNSGNIVATTPSATLVTNLNVNNSGPGSNTNNLSVSELIEKGLLMPNYNTIHNSSMVGINNNNVSSNNHLNQSPTVQ